MAKKVSPQSLTATDGALWNRLFAPVDIASIVYFRIAFGAIMLWEVWRYFKKGWIKSYYIDPTLHFTYYGFDWVRPWPGEGMYLHFLALGALATFILLGLWYRISAALFFLGFTYVFLLDQANYLNHFYLVCLISLLMVFVPAERAFSLDALRRPEIHSDTAPAWALWLLRAQIGIPYFYGGLAKLNEDWLRGEPLSRWLAEKTDFPVIGQLFTEQWMVYLFGYGGLLLDLLVVPLLLWRRTRPFAFAAAVLFHLLNAGLFQIGIFPWFMIAATALFFSPDWPRFGGRWWPAKNVGTISRKACPERRRRDAKPAKDSPRRPIVTSPLLRPEQRLTAALLGIYMTAQLLVPLRHFLYPGDVGWTEEGHLFAWHMMLRSKQAKAEFFATDPASGRSEKINPGDFLTPRQLSKFSRWPDMVLQFSHYVANEFRKQGYPQIEVRARVLASLNGRKSQLLIDPTVDLAAQSRTLKPTPWIIPLQEPLRRYPIEPATADEILDED
jgi:HTTM domain/Vitamin K-dependent gamma-carboxylase, lumenal domain